MSIAESLLPEFDHETATTRALLERVPDAKAAWKPHPKSMSLGQLAMHVATIPAWTTATLKQTEFDVNPPGGQKYVGPSYESTAGMLAKYDEIVASARALIATAPDGDMFVPWTLKDGGKAVFSLPRVAVLRSLVMNHGVHHRGQLSVYLRLCDVKLPSIYGPTADTI